MGLGFKSHPAKPGTKWHCGLVPAVKNLPRTTTIRLLDRRSYRFLPKQRASQFNGREHSAEIRGERLKTDQDTGSSFIHLFN